MRVSERIAVVGLLLESLGLGALAVWQVVTATSSEVGSVVSAGALIVLTVLGSAFVACLAFGVWRHRSWARSGGVVVQALIVAVGIGGVTGEYAHPGVAAALALPAIVVGIALVKAAGQAGAHPGARMPKRR